MTHNQCRDMPCREAENHSVQVSEMTVGSLDRGTDLILIAVAAAKYFQNHHERAYCGYCAAKKEKFFGWRLHLICTPSGIPVSFHLMPAAFHDLTPIHELAFVLPFGARLFGDKAYNSAPDETTILDETGVRLIPVRRANMQPHAWFLDDIELRNY